MKSSPIDLVQSLSVFSQQYLSEYQQRYLHLPLIEMDEHWLSPCLEGKFDDSHNFWQPCKMNPVLSFDNVEQALELSIHQDVKTYFTVFYSDTLDAICDDGDLSLLFAWSEEDFSRLQENMIGHILMKQKLKQPITVFFGVTDDYDMILTINNDSGEVWVEKVGRVGHKKIADSLSKFISSLTPRIP